MNEWAIRNERAWIHTNPQHLPPAQPRLPVILFSVLLVTGVKRCSSFLGKVQAAEIWFRRIVAAVFIIIGLYFTALLFMG